MRIDRPEEGFAAGSPQFRRILAVLSLGGLANPARASSMYLILYYVGSSVSGTLSTRLWCVFGWPGVLVMSAVWVAVGLLCALLLARRGAS